LHHGFSGTGWSTSIPNYNPFDVIENIRRLLNGDEMNSITPWYRGFRGSIDSLGEGKFAVQGCIDKVNTTTLRVTELPIGVWTNTYVETLTNLAEAKQIESFKNLSTDTAVCFEVNVSRKTMQNIEDGVGLYKFFKLQSVMSTGKCTESARIYIHGR
jgi:DNA topoisomerase II